MSVFIKKYNVINPMLKSLIKYYWLLESDFEIEISNTLLPVNNIDIMINYSEKITYEKDSKVIEAGKIHFNGVRKSADIIMQRGKLKVLGISFFPWGIYPLLKIPVNEFTNQSINMEDILKEFTIKLEDKLIGNNMSMEENIKIIESELIREINFSYMNINIMKLFESFYSYPAYLNIKSYSKKYNINIKQMERIFLKYTGVSPKVFKKISRFQNIINNLQNYKSLTELAHHYDYYDQSHFIKEFKVFSKVSPKQFLKEKVSIKQIMNSE